MFSTMCARPACSQSSEGSPDSNAHLAVGALWLQSHATVQTYMDSRNQLEFGFLHLHGKCFIPLIQVPRPNEGQFLLSNFLSSPSKTAEGLYLEGIRE